MSGGGSRDRPAREAEPSNGFSEGGRRGTTHVPLFLHKETYRRRRVMDAARLLPFMGLALLSLPMLWENTHSTASGAIYVLLAWFALIVAGGLMARKLAEPLRKPGPEGTGERSRGR